MTRKWIVNIDGCGPIGMAHDGETLTLWFRPNQDHGVRWLLECFGDGLIPSVVGSYKKRACVTIGNDGFMAGYSSFLHSIGMNERMARDMRRLMEVRALGRLAW